MTATLAARCCGAGAAWTGDDALMEDVRSALDLSDSDQLKPSPERSGGELDVFPIDGFLMLLCDCDDEDGDDDKPRPFAVGEDAGMTEALPGVFPFPDLASRNALAPKLIRRAKGVVGVDMGVASPSSTALSSMLWEPEFELE